MSVKNILLLTVDCLRYDRCGFNGHDRNTTPTLDRLAGRSAVFDEAYATGPFTPESFPGILAGRNSHESMYYSDPILKALPSSDPTLASFFADRGFHTTAVISNPHLTRERNFHIGFDEFSNLRSEQRGDKHLSTDDDSSDSESVLSAITARLSPGDMKSRMESKSSPYSLLPYTALFSAYRYYQKQTGWPSMRAEEVREAFLSRLDSTEEPFFAWTHWMDLHAPLHPKTVQEGGVSKSTWRLLATDSRRAANIETSEYGRMYDSALRYVDSNIAALIEGLNQRGLWEETVLIVTADHGDALFDRGVYGHERHYMYDDLLHVPLLVHGHGGLPQRVGTRFSLGWLHELLADIFGFERGNFPLGTDRDDHLDEPEDDELVVSDMLTTEGHTVAVRDAAQKYIYHAGEDIDANWAYADDGNGYAIASDRGERHELPDDRIHRPLADRARELETSPTELTAVRDEIGDTTKKQLEQLGYKM